MSVLVALATGFFAAQLLWRASSGLFNSVVLQRPNFRKRFIPTGVGIVVAFAVVLVEGGRVVCGAAGIGDSEAPGLSRVLVLVAAFGFGALGFVDDVLGGDAERGWRGHLGALREGRLSAGGVKIVGGGTLGLMLCSAGGSGFGGLGRLLADGALVALAANLANAFDRAPGRAVKVGLVAWVPLALVAGTGPAGVAIAVPIGATLGLLEFDLGERLMLGDAGANLLGGVLGVGAVLALGPEARNIVLIALVVLNVLAEVTSFSRWIDKTPPLRRLDRLGRMP
jgi:UDP-N-acetylmuramyl pentapeptide phosphotransferase/UDP-N-acetylglucosamine-1-phosphate transferase